MGERPDASADGGLPESMTSHEIRRWFVTGGIGHSHPEDVDGGHPALDAPTLDARDPTSRASHR